MHTIEIPEIKFKQQIPSTLEEMKPHEFAFLAGLLFELNSGKINISDLKIRMVSYLLNIKHKKKNYNKLSNEQKFRISENLYRISECLDFVFIKDLREGRPVLRFNFDFIHNPVCILPKKYHAGILRTLYGPADALQDITFKQYIDAHAYFESYAKTNDLAALDKLVAVLYRPKKKSHDLKKIERRARLISRYPLGYRFAVYLFFVACENFLKSGEVEFEGEVIKLSLLYESTIKERELLNKQKYKMKSSLLGIGFSLAETGIFGSLENVMEQNLYDILYLLYKQRIDYLNQLENYDRS